MGLWIRHISPKCLLIQLQHVVIEEGSSGTFATERCTQSWQGLRACIANNPDSPQEYTLSDLGFNASYDDKEIGITGKNVTVRGNHVVIDAGSDHQEFAKGGFFNVSRGGILQLEGITFRHGGATDKDPFGEPGGAIFIDDGCVSIANSKFDSSVGAIYCVTGAVKVTNTTFVDNFKPLQQVRLASLSVSSCRFTSSGMQLCPFTDVGCSAINLNGGTAFIEGTNFTGNVYSGIYGVNAANVVITASYFVSNNAGRSLYPNLARAAVVFPASNSETVPRGFSQHLTNAA